MGVFWRLNEKVAIMCLVEWHLVSDQYYLTNVYYYFDHLHNITDTKRQDF